MLSDFLLTILQWAVPGGLGGVATWLVSRRLRRMREVKEVHDTYKEMYHDISQEILELRKENAEILKKSERIADESRGLKRSLDRLSCAIEAIQLCPHRGNCPVRNELREPSVGGIDGGGEGAVRRRGQRKQRYVGPYVSKRDGGRCGDGQRPVASDPGLVGIAPAGRVVCGETGEPDSSGGTDSGGCEDNGDGSETDSDDGDSRERRCGECIAEERGTS